MSSGGPRSGSLRWDEKEEEEAGPCLRDGTASGFAAGATGAGSGVGSASAAGAGADAKD